MEVIALIIEAGAMRKILTNLGEYRPADRAPPATPRTTPGGSFPFLLGRTRAIFQPWEWIEILLSVSAIRDRAGGSDGYTWGLTIMHS